MLFSRLSPAFLALSLIAVAAPLRVSAASKPAPNTAPAPKTSAEVVIGGTLVHTVRTPWGGKTAQQRAAQVQQRLTQMLAQGPMTAADFTAGQVDGDWCVLFRGRRFLTADPASAQANQCRPEALAGQWAAHLGQVLPPLTKPKMGKQGLSARS